jgi:membrane protease YdiL (CAAX protease family)
MKHLLNILDPRSLCTSEQVKPTIFLIFAALVPALHRHLGSIEFARLTFPSLTEFGSVTYMFAAAFLLMGVLPFCVVHFIFRDSLKSDGLDIGEWQKALPVIAILFLLIAGILLYPSSQTAEMRSFYPFDKSAGGSIGLFLRLEILRGALFYTAWEFFFRGFLLFGLRKYFGDWGAICIQTIPSCLWHVGMPTGEIMASIAGGILFGILALRSRSILWVFLLHFLIGATTDFFIVMSG